MSSFGNYKCANLIAYVEISEVFGYKNCMKKSEPRRGVKERLEFIDFRLFCLGNHPKAAIDYHFKTGHRETA
jgi:hypothetical protein